jgi:hypothetical protein
MRQNTSSEETKTETSKDDVKTEAPKKAVRLRAGLRAGDPGVEYDYQPNR